MQVCLFGPPKLSLRPLLRDGASDQELLNEISVAIKGKKFAHDGKSSSFEITWLASETDAV